EIEEITKDKLDLICAVCLDPSVDQETRELMEDGMDERIRWIKEMIPNGLRILVASEKPRQEMIHYKWVGKMLHSDLSIHGRVPLGLLEYVPIEHALEPIDGKDSLFINCMWILPPFWLTGVGKALIEAFIERVKQYGGASVIAYEEDRWFGTSIKYMPSSFFKKFGFQEVDRDGSRVLLFLDLGAATPKFIFPESSDFQITEKSNLDIFYNDQCPWSKYMINTIKLELNKESNINIHLINTNDSKLIKKTGISRGVFLNGKPIIKRMASWEEIRLEIEKYNKEFH
ncbi:MAG: GNAT family N-acetyltransferase, partial [Promethearchaeota archaeon]